MGLEVAKVGFIQPVLDGLKRAGVQQQALFCKSGLDRINLDDLDNYVPVNAMYRFFALVRKQEGINDFLETFSDLVNLSSLSQWGEMIARTPDVLTAIKTAEKFNYILLSPGTAGSLQLQAPGFLSELWHPAHGRRLQGCRR